MNKNAARAMVILVAIAATMMCLNEVFQFAAVLVATDGSYLAAFGAAGSNALVMLLLDMHHYGFLIAQIFFGLWLVPLGYLAYKSGMFPKALGVVLIVGGVSYLVDMLAAFLLPDLGKQIHGFLAIPPTIAEIWMLICYDRESALAAQLPSGSIFLPTAVVPGRVAIQSQTPARSSVVGGQSSIMQHVQVELV